jgi:hypothetical protein
VSYVHELVRSGTDFTIEERFKKPTPKYPMGSYLLLWNGKPQIATGSYERDYPGHPSLYWHGGAPFCVMETGEWDFGKTRELQLEKKGEEKP